MSSSFKWNQQGLAYVRRTIQQGLLRMGADVAGKERQHAPYDTGNLVRSIRVDATEENVVYVKAGGNAGGFSVPYARRRNFENNLHPDTKHYMENGLLDVVRGGIAKYFKVQ